jgi:tetratricopeptide (TPR) repeat protein
MTFAAGDYIGPYEVIERQGQGGMATVYRGYHAALDRFVALKLLNPAYSEDSNFLARFQREARVVARLEHPNIVPIYDFAEHESTPYLVMKFIDGETLKQRLFRGPLTLEEGLRIIEDVGNALMHAHEQGVLHRDIKPSNVLIDEDGSVFLADFGLARLARVGSSTLSSEMLLGTPHYISPEQAQGESDLDERTDIYSFGAVLYELVVGQVPFDGDTPFSIIHDHIYEPLPDPRSINPDVPEPVERVLKKALAKPKAERYDSVKGLLSAFLAAATGDQVGVLRGPKPAAIEVDEVPEAAATTTEWVEESVPEPVEEEQEKVEEVLPTADEKVKKQRNWGWIVAGVILACSCLAVLFNARNLINRFWGNNPDIQSTQSFQETLSPPRLTPDPSIGAVEHLQTAEALATAGFRRDVLDELLIAGELFLAEGSYLQAAKVFQTIMNEVDGPASVGPYVRDSLLHALFMGVTDPGMEEVGSELMEDYPDWTVLAAIEARAWLLGGDLEGAARLIDSALQAEPNDAIALAVKAEWLIASGENAEARGILNRLSRRSLQPWLNEHVAHLSGIIEGTP